MDEIIHLRSNRVSHLRHAIVQHLGKPSLPLGCMSF